MSDGIIGFEFDFPCQVVSSESNVDILYDDMKKVKKSIKDFFSTIFSYVGENK